FIRRVRSSKPRIQDGILTYKTVYGDVLTLDTRYKQAPTVNRQPLDYSPGKAFDSPFLHGDYNGTTFVIEKGERRRVYSIPPLR
ncbi:MAG: hypothetical protein ACPGSB_10140, partial [Opitutales bacterium]